MFTKTGKFADTNSHTIKDLIGESQDRWDEVVLVAPDTNSATVYAGACNEQRIPIVAGSGFNFKHTQLSEIYVKGTVDDEITIVGV